jgi:hypothetical protein
LDNHTTIISKTPVQKAASSEAERDLRSPREAEVDNAKARDSHSTRYFILRGKLYRILEGEVIPAAWKNGSWEKEPFVFGLEVSGHMVSPKEASDWIRIRARNARKGRTF